MGRSSRVFQGGVETCGGRDPESTGTTDRRLDISTECTVYCIVHSVVCQRSSSSPNSASYKCEFTCAEVCGIIDSPLSLQASCR